MIFFTADVHFGHANIIRLCGRPFRTVCEMNHALVDNWNKRVSGKDTVYILGDLFYKCDPPVVLAILSALKGKKKLIIGNHDAFWLENCPQAKGFFLSIDPFWSGSVGNHGMTLCHYPLVTYKHQQKDYQIHGHIHNDTSSDYWPLLKARPLTLNAGVDINGFEPVTLEELMVNNLKWKKTH